MRYPTRASEWSIGAGYAVAVGAGTVSGHAGYGQQRFRIVDDDQPGDEQVPDVDYRWVRAALDGAGPLSARWSVEAGFGLRYLLDAGDLFGPAWFPRGTGTGLDADAGLRVRIGARLELFARASVRHYFFGMNPAPGDARIVGGAVDTYLGGAVGAALAAF